MPVLAYCLMERHAAPRPEGTGVRGAALFHVVEDSLVALASAYEPAADPGEALGEALAYNQVVQRVFEAHDLVPFRFPTVMPAEEGLRAHLAQHAAEYARAMERLRGTAQFEIKLSVEPSESAPQSGTEYLKERLATTRALEAAMQQVRQAGADHLVDWREQSAIRRADARQTMRRCFALVRRSDVHGFQQALAPLTFEAGLRVVLSGPWPPAEFFRPARAQEPHEPA